MKPFLTILLPLFFLSFFFFQHDLEGCIWSAGGLLLGVVIFLLTSVPKGGRSSNDSD